MDHSKMTSLNLLYTAVRVLIHQRCVMIIQKKHSLVEPISTGAKLYEPMNMIGGNQPHS